MSISARDRPVSITLSILIVVAFSYYVSLEGASHELNFLGLSVLIATSFFVVKSKGGWVFLLYAFGLTFALASGVFIELLGASLIEIREAAYLTGAAARNSFLATFFLILSYAACRQFSRLMPSGLPTVKGAEPIALRLLLVAAFIAPMYIAMVLFTHGSPLFLGMDRFGYFTNVAPAGYVWVYGNIPLLGLIVSLARYKGLVSTATSIIWLAFTVVMYTMAGEKFSQLFLLGFFFFLPYFVISNPYLKTRHIVFGTVSVLFMAGLVVLNYEIIYGSAEMLVPRFALQGQMNYALDKISGPLQPTSIIVQHFAGFGAQESDRGLVYLMYSVAPPDVVDSRIEHGATFTAPFPANFCYFFGHYFAPLVVVPAGILAGAVSALLAKSISQINVLLSVVATKLFVLIYTAIFMGQTHLLVEPKAIVFVMLLALYFLALAVPSYATDRSRL